jgi:hypothetical protein
MFGIMFVLIVWLIVFAGAYFLEVYLSQKRSKYPGVILPVAFFMVSVLLVSGDVSDVFKFGFSIGAVITVIIFFVFLNIPTAALWLVYKSKREKLKKNDELTRMNIQDL